MRTHRNTKPRNSLAGELTVLALCAVLPGALVPAHSDETRDIFAPSEYADFIREAAIPTVQAETRTSDVVKFLMIGKGEDGQIIVRTIGLLSIGEHAPSADSESVDMAVIAHVHHESMGQAPSKEDALTVRQHGIPNFVISSDGRLIWEVGIIAGKDVYREIGATGIGTWLDLR